MLKNGGAYFKNFIILYTLFYLKMLQNLQNFRNTTEITELFDSSIRALKMHWRKVEKHIMMTHNKVYNTGAELIEKGNFLIMCKCFALLSYTRNNSVAMVSIFNLFICELREI